MGLLTDQLAGKRRLLTQGELRNLLGKPHAPCQSCGSAILAILHDGAIVCPYCADDPTQIANRTALRVILLVDSCEHPGVPVLRSLSDVENASERKQWIEEHAYWLTDRSGQRRRQIITPERYLTTTRAERMMPLDEFFDSNSHTEGL